MARGNSQTNDAEARAAVDFVAGGMHDSWRREFLKNNPAERGKPRMRMRGGAMVDVNQPWSKLDPKAKADNMRAARDAYDAVKKFPRDREAAAEQVHVRWIKRNKADPSQPKDLFKPYAKLPEIEKDKDRAHVDAMTKAIATVRKSMKKTAPRKAKPGKTAPRKATPSRTAVRIDAGALRRLQSAAKRLSKALGREVPAELLLAAGADAMAAVAKTLAAKSRARR